MRRYAILLLLAAGPLHAQQKRAPQLEQQRIELLLELLDSPSFRMRQRAKKELLRAGKPALLALARFISGAPSLHARKSAQAIRNTIVTKLRWATFKGGPIAAGLQATLRSEKAVYAQEERLWFQLEIRNVSRQPVRLNPLTAFDLGFRCGENQDIQWQQQAEARINLRRMSKPARMNTNYYGRPAAHEPPTPTQLRPGRSHWRKFRLDRLPLYRNLPPGRYQLTVSYYNRGRTQKKHLLSNCVSFRIVAGRRP